MVTLLLEELGGTPFENRGDKTHISEEETQTWQGLVNQSINIAENAVRTLQSNNVFTNGPNLVADEMTDTTGTKNTINTGTSTALFNPLYNYYQLDFTPDAVDDTITLSDSQALNTNSAVNTGNEFTVLQDSFIMSITKMSSDASTQCYIAESWLSTGNPSTFVALASFSGNIATFSSPVQLFKDKTYYIIVNSNGANRNIYYDSSETYPKDNSDISVINSRSSGGVFTTETWSLVNIVTQTGVYNSSDTVICDNNTTALDGNELGFATSVPDSDLPTGTGITVTISDGTNSLSPKSINTVKKGVIVGNSGTLTSGTLEPTFTLTTTDTSITPTLPVYAISILRG